MAEMRVAAPLTSALDLSTRYFWRIVGRSVDLSVTDSWLDSPSNARGGIGDDWLNSYEAAGLVRAASSGDGLLDSMTTLDGPEFAAAKVDPQVRDFYERTASWGMEVWSQWNGV